jgi:SAM-dependent MidA family methyltransferase
LFAEGLAAMKEAVGSDQFSLVELGAGDGEFLRGILEALESQKKLGGMRVYAIERSRPSREKLWRALSRFPKCEILESIDQIDVVGGLDGCIFTNELFDALPFHRLRFKGNEWKEIYVDLGKSGLTDKEGPLSDEVKPLVKPILAMPGQEVEVRPAIHQLYQDWSRLLARGFVVSIDYGHPRAELYSPRRPKGTWLCYYKHKAHDNPYQNVGDQDVTAHVDFTQLAEAGKAAGFDPSLFATQGVFFSFLGKTLIPQWLEGGSPAARAKKQGALQQVLHPEAMGETFKVLVQQKSVALPSIFTEIPSRLKRLGV